MKLTSVHSMNSPQVSWRIVREWDEIVASTLGLKLKSENKLSRYLKWGVVNKYGCAELYNKLRLTSSNKTLYFAMSAETKTTCYIGKNTIPVVIDFWLKEKDLPLFYNVYKDVPLALVTNKEVYDFLKLHHCPIPVEHWALSFPDQYALSKESLADKKYDFCFFGRPNPFFVRLLEQYAEQHPDFVYVLNQGNIDNRQYVTNKGDFVAKDTGRASYLQMMRQTKISCYTTPGIDEAKKETSIYNQVTPRLFEMLCNGVQVIGHYPEDGADVQWYGLKEVVPNVNNYYEFAHVLDRFRKEPFNFEVINKFVCKHYTSQRANELRAILAKHHITL